MKCENCGSSENLFKVKIISPCGEHTHYEIYCNAHMADLLRDDPTCIELIKKIS